MYHMGKVRGVFFFYCILLTMLLQLSCFFLFAPLPPSTPHSLRQSSHHCSCPWGMRVSSLSSPFPVLYLTIPWPVCNYLFVLLNLLTSSPIPPHLPLSVKHQNALCIHDSVSVLLVCLVFSFFFRFNC